MKKKYIDSGLVAQSVLIIVLFLIVSLLGNHTINVFSNEGFFRTVVIDAGHGGVDGGAISCTGIRESTINLEIAIKLDDLMHLLGIHTVMVRNTERSIHTEGESIAAKKISDIRNRVKIVNEMQNAILVSIHQNNYTDSKCSGAQIFHNQYDSSKILAGMLQDEIRKAIDSTNNRKIKKASGIYLMEHINCTGILIECGFLSNPAEENNLRDKTYQQKLCCVIATTISQYLNT